MRKILFRGKRKDNGEWVYGFLIKGQRAYIATCNAIEYMVVSLMGMASLELVEVIPETVGAYIGLQDKNGNKIFEGDILAQQICGDNYVLGVVKYGEGTFDSGYYRYTGFFYEYPANGSHDHTNIVQSKWLNDVVEVIGNIYDNKNLLEE